MISANNSLCSSIGKYATKAISSRRRRVYWFERKLNFGDLLTPALLNHYGYKPVHYKTTKARIVAVGSVIHLLPVNYSGIVLGSGLIRDESIFLPNANFQAVRGPLTRERVAAPSDVILGDPGLLADRLISRREEKRWTLGFVPHMYDIDNVLIKDVKNKYPKETCVIDVRRDPQAVIRDIDQCENVLSSSLHGLVVADSLGIPAGWLHLSDRVIGGGFKFMDYNCCVGARFKPVPLYKNNALSTLIREVRIPEKDLYEIANHLENLFRVL